MTRETDLHQTIALLATGDEISQGDILNTNSQEIALRLTQLGMQVRTHVTAPDTLSEIVKALQFLLANHQAIIITGGLGPTSDDLTRFALAETLQLELTFDEATWASIVARLKKFGYPTPPESNRQQALFPEKATIIPNPNGTAAGCFVEVDDKLIFMLPGPPSECLPIVEDVVIPKLIKNHFQQTLYRKKWLLFGVSEGKIAEELDALTEPFDCTTGYRLWHPYLEFKLHSSNQYDFDAATSLVEEVIKPYLLGDGKEAASALLCKKLAESPIVIRIHDQATGGLLESTIKTPTTSAQLDFSCSTSYDVEISGLTHYWERLTETSTTLTLRINDFSQTFTLPFRGKRVLRHAVELICDRLLKALENNEIKDATS